MFTKDGVPLPMVTIMIEGGMQSLDQAVSTLRKGNWRAYCVFVMLLFPMSFLLNVIHVEATHIKYYENLVQGRYWSF